MVSVDWLSKNIDRPDVLVVDATWCMPSDPEPNPGTFIDGIRFDIDYIADTSAPFAHTLSSPEKFEHEVRKLGVNENTHIVCYDRHGLFSAPRAWWMFRVMGHEKVSVLDGGLPAWIKAGHATSAKYRSMPGGDFKVSFQPHLLKRKQDVLDALAKTQILDARPKGRFDGTAPEPRAGLSSGHMPGASNVPFSTLKTADGFLKTKQELQDVFASRNVDLRASMATTCGSGITACGIALALARVGAWHAAIYDGSWTEWASSDNCPIEKAG